MCVGALLLSHVTYIAKNQEGGANFLSKTIYQYCFIGNKWIQIQGHSFHHFTHYSASSLAICTATNYRVFGLVVLQDLSVNDQFCFE